MKILPLLTAVMLTLSLTGAVQAEVDHAAPAQVASATIDAPACAPHVAAPCSIAGDAVDLEALPRDNPQQALDNAPAPVPEPQTFIMMMLGLVVLGVASHRRHPSERFD